MRVRSWGGVRVCVCVAGVTWAVTAPHWASVSYKIKVQSSGKWGQWGKRRAVNHVTLYAKYFRLYAFGREYP